MRGAVAQRRFLRSLAVGLLALPLAATATGSTWAAWSTQTQNIGNAMSAKPDWVPPTVSATQIVLSSGKAAGMIRPGGTYHVYANVSDTGAPPSGVASVTSNLSNLTTGASSQALNPGSFLADGTTYSWRSPQLTADAGLVDGQYTYPLVSVDAAGNARTQTGFPVTVDATPPSAADIQTLNTSGGTRGKVETGDALVYHFSEAVDPASIMADWDGSSRAVGVVGAPVGNGANVTSQWTVHTTDYISQLPLGTVAAGKHLTHNNGSVMFAATMALSADTLTITFGAVTNAAAIHSSPATAYTMVWTPSTAVTDLVGNSATATARTELGANDADF